MIRYLPLEWTVNIECGLSTYLSKTVNTEDLEQALISVCAPYK